MGSAATSTSSPIFSPNPCDPRLHLGNCMRRGETNVASHFGAIGNAVGYVVLGFDDREGASGMPVILASLEGIEASATLPIALTIRSQALSANHGRLP